MKDNTHIKGNCPECGRQGLILREDDIYCTHCQNAVLHEIPKTPEGEREVIKAIENYLTKSIDKIS
jgi:hypothetical protein